MGILELLSLLAAVPAAVNGVTALVNGAKAAATAALASPALTEAEKAQIQAAFDAAFGTADTTHAAVQGA